MKNLSLFTKKLIDLPAQAGFTMIELLVVISVIGVLAVAVLSSINPIEQINKGRDTRTRSDAAQLINAVDRYFAIHEEYPWNVAAASTTPCTFAEVTASGTSPAYAEPFDSTQDNGCWNWIDVLSTTAEVKQGFVNRIKSDDTIKVFKADGSNETMYACFIPSSQAFKLEAAKNCSTVGGATPTTPSTVIFENGGGTGVSHPACAGATGVVVEGVDNYICLP